MRAWSTERLFVTAVASLLAASSVVASLYGSHLTAIGLRWLTIAILTAVAVKRRSLTPWIFVAMIAGAELGFDAPHFATSLRVFSDIFLRLIKAIVAPLIFATLVTGIAGHGGDVKSVGRIGIKSLIYFEVITTLALVIGLVAINLSQAGRGLSLPSNAALESTQGTPPPTGWQDFVLHVFPENIAKSVADGQILQVAVFAIFLALLWPASAVPAARLFSRFVKG